MIFLLKSLILSYINRDNTKGVIFFGKKKRLLNVGKGSSICASAIPHTIYSKYCRNELRKLTHKYNIFL